VPQKLKNVSRCGKKVSLKKIAFFLFPKIKGEFVREYPLKKILRSNFLPNFCQIKKLYLRHNSIIFINKTQL
jgi:hypothetical protein